MWASSGRLESEWTQDCDRKRTPSHGSVLAPKSLAAGWALSVRSSVLDWVYQEPPQQPTTPLHPTVRAALPTARRQVSTLLTRPSWPTVAPSACLFRQLSPAGLAHSAPVHNPSPIWAPSPHSLGFSHTPSSVLPWWLCPLPWKLFPLMISLTRNFFSFRSQFNSLKTSPDHRSLRTSPPQGERTVLLSSSSYLVGTSYNACWPIFNIRLQT